MNEIFKSHLEQVLALARVKLCVNIGTEASPMHMGNVEFWKDGGEWCYSIPVAQWDSAAVTADIVFWLEGRAK